MADKIEFSTYQLLIDNQYPRKDMFSCLPQSISHSGDYIYLGETQLTDSYFWISFDYGKTYPRADEVIDEKTLQRTPNPRGSSQLEPNRQLFCLIAFDTGTLFLSSMQKKGFIEDFFKQYLQKDISVKNIFKTIEEFYQQISSIDTISFSSVKRDLFSGSGLIQQTLQDNYGMEEPEEFFIQAKYGTNLSAKIKNLITRLRKEKQDFKLTKLIIQGRDDQGFAKVFNEGNFINKIEVFPEKNSEGLYTAMKVRDLLLEKIK